MSIDTELVWSSPRRRRESEHVVSLNALLSTDTASLSVVTIAATSTLSSSSP